MKNQYRVYYRYENRTQVLRIVPPAYKIWVYTRGLEYQGIIPKGVDYWFLI